MCYFYGGAVLVWSGHDAVHALLCLFALCPTLWGATWLCVFCTMEKTTDAVLGHISTFSDCVTNGLF